MHLDKIIKRECSVSEGIMILVSSRKKEKIVNVGEKDNTFPLRTKKKSL